MHMPLEVAKYGFCSIGIAEPVDICSRDGQDRELRGVIKCIPLTFPLRHRSAVDGTVTVSRYALGRGASEERKEVCFRAHHRQQGVSLIVCSMITSDLSSCVSVRRVSRVKAIFSPIMMSITTCTNKGSYSLFFSRVMRINALNATQCNPARISAHQCNSIWFALTYYFV